MICYSTRSDDLLGYMTLRENQKEKKTITLQEEVLSHISIGSKNK